MPAARDEIEDVLREGIVIEELLGPSRVLVDDAGRVRGVECAQMRLGEPDASGRRRPVPIPGAVREIAADAVLVAVGQARATPVVLDDPERFQLGGDAARGPSSIVEAIADGRAFAERVAGADAVLVNSLAGPRELSVSSVGDALARRSRRADRREDPREEAARCLSCDTLCALCVTVCPNRANILYELNPLSANAPELVVRGGALVPSGKHQVVRIAQRYQVANVADMCNECGNCAAFCPTAGAPYRHKPKVFLSPTEDGRPQAPFALHLRGLGAELLFQIRGEPARIAVEQNGDCVFESPAMTARLDANFELSTASLLCEAKDGAVFDTSEIVRAAALARALHTAIVHRFF